MRGDLYEALHQLVFGDDEPQYTYTSTRNYDEFDPSRDSWSEIMVEYAWNKAIQQLISYLKSGQVIAYGRKSGIGEPIKILQDFWYGKGLVLLEPYSSACYEFDPSRDSWSEITVELADLQPLWSRRETGREDNQKEQATSVKRFSERNVMRWFCEKYLPGLVAAGREPNRDQMVEDTRAEFGDSVPVKFVHQLRSEYAPEKWKKGGRRKSGKK